MRKRGIIFSLSILLLGGLLSYRYYTCPYYLDGNTFRDIPKSSGADPAFYEKQCAAEFSGNLSFPLGKVDKAIVTKGFFSIDHTIDKTQIPQILNLLNDTSNYVWGEVGRFWLGKRITDIDVSGTFTYSYPYLNRMKWGTLTQAAADDLSTLIAP